MNAYVIAGAAFAVWAVLVSLAGMRGFPTSKGGQMFAIGVSMVLFVVAVGSAIGDTTKVGERKGKETEEKKPASEAPQSAPAPAAPAAPQTSTPAPAAPAAPAGAETDLALSADPTGQLKFDKTALDAKAGQVKITLTNPVTGAAQHRDQGADHGRPQRHDLGRQDRRRLGEPEARHVRVLLRHPRPRAGRDEGHSDRQVMRRASACAIVAADIACPRALQCTRSLE